MRRRLVLVPIVVITAALLAGAGDAVAAKGGNRASGIGTAAALDGPNCDPDTGRVKLPYTGVPECVRELADGQGNGGATAPGVTADTIEVVVLVWNDQQASAATGVAPRDQATGSQGTQEDAVLDTAQLFEHATYQWNRKIEYTFVTSSGSDEAAQRADAVTVSAMKPFLVVNLAGGSTFDSQVASRKIVVLTSGNATKEQTTSLAPYIWAQQPDPDGAATNAAEFIAKSLDGKPAKWAGDEDLRDQERKFGVVYPPTIIDYPGFEAALKRFGAAEPAVAIEYTPPDEGTSESNLTANRELAPTIITRLKSEGVNNVILLTQNLMTQALTDAATEQDFAPEWTITGYGVNDFDYFARQFDQEQYAHAFGIGSLPPAVLNSPDYTSVLFQWYWGPSQGTVQAQTTGLLASLYSGIQMAGPTLTAKTYQRGLFTSPPVGGAAQDQVTTIQRAYGTSAGLPYDEYHQSGTDFSLVWWDSTAEGPSNIFPVDGTGKLQFLNGAQRYTAGEWPKGEPKFFDASSSVLLFDGIPATDQPLPYPCDGCPGGGGA